MNSQYANEVCYACKTSKETTKVASLTFSVGRDEVKPYTLARWSRFVVTLIEKKGDEKKIVTANIPAREVAAIGIITRNVLTAATMEEILNTSSKSDETELEKSLKFVAKMGTNKGKTYADIVSVSGYRDGITRQRDFLAKNVSKYPSNQAEIDAINCILSSSETDIRSSIETIKGSGIASTGGAKLIYDSGMKPLQSTADGNGVCTCYKIQIGLDMSRTYPFFIEIENLKAPVRKGETGQLQMVLSDSRDQKKSIYWFTLKDGLTWIAEMEKKVEQYEICSFSKQHRLVEEAIATARNNAKNS